MSEELKLRNYIVGFVLSIGITLVAYMMVVHHWFASSTTIEFTVAALALVQFIIQIGFFLHLSFSRHNRARLAVFSGMLGIILILVVGSLWIMHNMDYRMMPSQASVDEYMDSQDGM